MMWVAIVYALVSTWLTHRVGRSLVSINFDRLRFEADFRYGLVRFRDHVEAVALSRGDAVERARRARPLPQRDRQLVGAHHRAAEPDPAHQRHRPGERRRAAAGRGAGVLRRPHDPRQRHRDRIAYGQVSGALSWFVDAYQEIAAWRASIERLATFDEMLDEHPRRARRPDGIRFDDRRTAGASARPLALREPDGDGARARPQRRRRGGRARRAARLRRPAQDDALPRHRRHLALRQRPHRDAARARNRSSSPSQPYLPIGTLREAVVLSGRGRMPSPTTRCATRCRPSTSTTSPAASTRASRGISSSRSTSSSASPSPARSCTSPIGSFWTTPPPALDEATEAKVYAVLRERLPRSGVLSLSTRPTIAGYHGRQLTLKADAIAPSA